MTSANSKAFKSLIYGLLLLIVANCSSKDQFTQTNTESKNKTAIVGGEPVSEDDPIAKTTVALYITFPNSSRIQNFCTGTVIRTDVVVSAGHCIVDVADMLKVSVPELLSRVKIGFGTQIVRSLNDNRVKFTNVKTVNVHPEYKSDALEDAEKGVAFYDISILHLSEPLPAEAVPAKLMDNLSDLKAGLTLTLAGYGVIRGGNYPVSATELRRTDVVVDNPALNPVQFSYKNINGHSACSGDSGGPAYLIGQNGQLLLAGATSWGDQNCTQLGVYTSVPALYSWIISVL